MKLGDSKFKIKSRWVFVQREVKLWNSLPEVDMDAKSFLGLRGKLTKKISGEESCGGLLSA